MASPFHSTKLLWEIRHWTLRWLGEKTARGVVDSERLLRSEKKTGGEGDPITSTIHWEPILQGSHVVFRLCTFSPPQTKTPGLLLRFRFSVCCQVETFRCSWRGCSLWILLSQEVRPSGHRELSQEKDPSLYLVFFFLGGMKSYPGKRWGFITRQIIRISINQPPV